MKPISVIGFGKIGQAVAANILVSGINVVAVDLNAAIATSFIQKQFSTNEPGLEKILVDAFAGGKLTITKDYVGIKDSQAIIISIPLLITKDKKVAAEPFKSCLKHLAPFLSEQVLVITETSLPVGFSRDTVLPALEKAGPKHGVDFLLAHSPERIKSGTMLQQLASIPKVIGGINDEAALKAMQVYGQFFPKDLLIQLSSVEAAEMLKLAGMIYRDVNIALANQLAQFAGSKGIPFADIISIINTDKEANILQPGIGVGGHCTPVYPYFLINNFKDAGLDFSLAVESRMINNEMAEFAISLVRGKVKNKKALILGLGFRPNVKEDSLSTTYILNEALIWDEFEVRVHDTVYSSQEIESKGLKPALDIYETGAEVLFLVTMHDEYQQLDFKKLAAKGLKFFVDGRNSFDPELVRSSGIQYFGIGR